MPSIHRKAVVPYSAQQMYDLVDDINAYPDFLPWCSGSTEKSRDDDQVIASITISKGALKKSFTTLNRLSNAKMIEMKLVEGPFKRLQGLWRFTANDDGGCEVSFDVNFQFANNIIAMVVGPVFTNIAETLVSAFIKQAHHKYGVTDDDD